MTVEERQAGAAAGSRTSSRFDGTGWTETYMGGSLEAERELLKGLMPRVTRIQDLVAARQRAPIRRAFHNKGTVVRIHFDVAASLPEGLRIGLLEPGASYPGFGRFSRSQSVRQRDGDPDQRGFAFRIETLAGPQDILCSNTPASFARDPVQFLTVALLFAESPLPVAALRVLPTVGLREGIRILLDLLRAPDRTVAFTAQRYWSRTPFQIGAAAARLFVRPTVAGRRVPKGKDPDFLTTELAADLRERARTFELCAQPFVDELRTPIEDSSKVWEEAVSPPIVLGTVTVLRQDIHSPDARELARRVETGEAFNPAVTQHLRPLGRMNRARTIAYARSAEHRGVPRARTRPVPTTSGEPEPAGQ